MLCKIWSFVRHNSGIVIGSAFVPFILIYAYACQSTVVSLINSNVRVTRQEILAEVELFLARAESKISDLDRQDLVKGTMFNAAVEFAQGKAVNPLGVATLIGNILGIGAIIDNVRKRTFINTLKGETVNGIAKPKRNTVNGFAKTKTSPA